jgi:outer membrane protein assembly factor BamB
MRRRDLLAGSAAGVGALLAGCSDTAGESEGDGEPTDEWSQLQAGAAHAGATTASGPAGGGRVRWWSDTWGSNTAPVVDEEAVYLGSGLHSRAVFAFERGTGDRRWRTPVGGQFGRALALGDDTVYASADGVYALDTETGDRRWTDGVDTSWGLSLADGTVFAAAGGGGPLVALDAETGDRRWRRDVHTITTPTVADGRVFATGNDDLLAVDAESGDTVWRKAVDRAGRPPTVAAGQVIVPTRGALFAHDAATGDREWRLEGRFRATDVAAADGTVYLAGRRRDGESEKPAPRALAVDAATGEVAWSRTGEQFATGSVVVAGGTVYVATRRRVYALDRETGDTEWWLRFQRPVGSPAVADGTLYASAGGRLLAVGSGDGRAGVWRSDADPVPDRDASPSAPNYTETDFPFGTGGFDVDVDAEVTVTEDAPVDVAFEADGDEIGAGEAVSLRLAVTNEGEEPLTISTGAPEPFGVFTLADGDFRITAWTPAYEESTHVFTARGRGVTAVNAIGLLTELPPGETTSETYTLSEETHGVRPGTYDFSVGGSLLPADRETGRDGWEFEASGTVEIAARETDAGAVVSDLAVADEVRLPEAFAGRFAVDVLAPVTETHPGLLEVTLENVADERSPMASVERRPFGSPVGLGPEGRRLVLLPAGSYAPGFVERTDVGWWEPTFLPHESATRDGGTAAYDPGETVTARFVVVAHPETDAPRGGDGYAFEQGYGDDDVDVTWGFTLSTLDPDG